MAGDFAVLDHGFAADDGVDGPAFDLEAFIGAVITALLEDVVGDGDVFVGVPKCEVGVGANGDGALLRVHAIQFGVVGGCEGDKTVEVYTPP